MKSRKTETEYYETIAEIDTMIQNAENVEIKNLSNPKIARDNLEFIYNILARNTAEWDVEAAIVALNNLARFIDHAAYDHGRNGR